MDLGEILWVIRKRWYIMVPTVLAAVVLAVGAYLSFPSKYESDSTIALLNAQRPATSTTPGQSNPFLAFDPSLTATADYLARNLTSDTSAAQLKGEGVTEQYTATLAANAQGPFVALTVTGTDNAHVLASSTTLASFASQRLQQIQQQNGVPPGNMIHTATIVPPQEPQQLLKNKVQGVAAVGLGGLVLAFMATFITEGLYRSRHRRSSAEFVGSVDGAGAAEPAAPAVTVAPRRSGRQRPAHALSTASADTYRPTPADRSSAPVTPTAEDIPQDETAELILTGAAESAPKNGGQATPTRSGRDRSATARRQQNGVDAPAPGS